MPEFKSLLRLEVVAAAGIALFISACATSSLPQEEPEPAPERRAVARVNGETVYRDELIRFITLRLEDETEPTPAHLREYITHRVLLQEADRVGVEVEQARLHEVAGRWLGQNLESGSIDEIGDLLRVEKLLQSNIEAENSIRLVEMQQFYEKHAEEFVQQDRLLVLEILVPERKLAERLRNQLQPGDFRTFREQATLHSVGTTAKRGGELGVFERGDLPQRFERVVFALRVGEISEVFQSERGFHLFTVEQHTPRHPLKFYEAYNEIFERLVMERERLALEEQVDELVGRATIEILDPSLAGRGSEKNVAFN